MEFDCDWLDFEEDSSIDLSFPREFAEYFSTELGEKLKNSFEEIGEIWRMIGLPATKRDEQVEHIRDTIVGQMNKFVQDEREILQKIRTIIELKLKEINKILNDLSLPPYSLPEDVKTLIGQLKILQEKYKELLEIKNDRMEHLERIESKLKKVCHLSGIDYKPTKFATDIPSESELRSLAQILKNNEKILINRKTSYDSLQPIVQQLRSELEYVAETEDEKMLLDQPKEEFIFSQQNMLKLMDFNKKLIDLYNSRKAKIESLISTLEQLYNRLDVSQTERDQFSKCLSGTIPQQESLLNEEIAKYEIIKKNSIEKIIKNIRNEITTLLNNGMFTKFDEELMESEEYTEQLLIKLELEFEKLKKFNDCYQIVFQKLREWEDSLEKLIELEKKSMDPNRFTNRGGALLQNERDRKMLTKKLPRFEKEIRSLILNIENQNGIPFNTYGLDIDDFFQSNWKHLDSFKNSFSKTSQNKTKSSCSSSTKKPPLTSSAQKDHRIPFSPRNDIQKAANHVGAGLKRNLDVDLKKVDSAEFFFKKGLEKDLLHSTMLQQSENHFPSLDLHTPNGVLAGKMIRHKELRRRSRSCEPPSSSTIMNNNKNIAKARARFNINNMGFNNGPSLAASIETVNKRPPFLP